MKEQFTHRPEGENRQEEVVVLDISNVPEQHENETPIEVINSALEELKEGETHHSHRKPHGFNS